LGDLARENPEQLYEFREATPDDPAMLLGLAVQHLNEQDFSAAVELLQKMISSRPK